MAFWFMRKTWSENNDGVHEEVSIFKKSIIQILSEENCEFVHSIAI